MEKKENISKETFAQTIAGEIKQTTLKNGLRIVTADWPQVESVMVSIFVNTGSSRESEAENGISHFIEHLMFKGAGKRNAQQITADIANVGGSINAYTEKEFTCYDARVLKEYLELATDVLADFIMAPTLDPEEINREKGVVIQEINRYADIPGYIVNRYFLQTAFPNQAMGRSTLGTPENIRRMDKAMIQRYLRTHYVASNIVAAAVGRVDHDKFVKMVEDRMSALPEHSDFAEITPHYVGGEKIVCKELAQTHLAMGFAGTSTLTPDYYRYVALANILGGGMSSRLFREVREKRGLVYTINCANYSCKNAGAFKIYAGTTPKEMNTLLPVVVTELKKLMNDKVSAEELTRTQTLLRAGLLMSQETLSGKQEKIARETLLFNRVIPTEETIAKIEAITADDLQTLAQKIFSSTPTYAVLGPESNYPGYAELQELLKL